MRNFLIALCALGLTAPVMAQEEAVTVYVPETAIAAAKDQKDGVGGLFVMTVESVAKAGKTLYLNSHDDYRDRGNLSIAVNMDIYDQLRRSVGGDPEVILEGKRIRVAGVAKATPIKRRGRSDDQVSYYQTRVYVYDARQIEVID
ncbi:hypothetical protein [Sphingomicrobium flavum]|uniref:hypothetical protein n=1 Tax=Sphingomicrobium flavum TaxID=1229164 RepID=UPI0021AD979F|nr:hypothetical protein [Sphingomicrobium flavum]